jgi:hypothetical protein
MKLMMGAVPNGRLSHSSRMGVWSTPFLTLELELAMKHPMVIKQRQYMQRLAGAQRPNSRVLYMEFSELPLQRHWATLVFRFWNSMVRTPGTLCHNAFRSDIHMAFTHGFGWVHDVLKFLRELQPTAALAAWLPQGTAPATHVDYYASLELPVEELLSIVADRLLGARRDPDLDSADPRTYAGPQVGWLLHSLGTCIGRRLLA